VPLAVACSGAVNWVRSLQARIKEPMEKMRQLNKGTMDSEEAKDINKLYM
jgi:hypothetical protein